MEQVTDTNKEINEAEAAIKMAQEVFARYAYDRLTLEVGHAKNVPAYLTATFRNQRNGMSIRLAYFPPRVGMGRMMVATIVDKNGRDFYLKEWLANRGRRTELDILFDQPLSIGAEKFVANAIHLIEKLIESDLRGVIEARDWEETPRDWAGLK